jgi:phage-related minor tail protein
VASEIRESQTAMATSVETIQNIEKTHETISSNIEAVLQDYKKIHSAFEFVELELKKTSSSIETVKSEMVDKLDGTSKLIKTTSETLSQSIETAKNESLQFAEKNHKKLMNGIYIAIGISACAVILSLIGLFL